MNDPRPVADAGERIAAAQFRPTEAVARQRAPLLTPRRVVLASVAVLAAWCLWFIFTAKSVRFEALPADAAITIDGGFVFGLGEIQLLRQGDYRIRATASGYFDLERNVAVGAERNQTVQLELTRLPGRVSFDVDPQDATVTIAGNDDWRGQAPFQALLPAGKHVAQIDHARYQSATVAFEVEGMDRPQTVVATLARNWADVTIPSVPPGAEILVDDGETGVVTPGPAAILAGEHRVSLRLPGYRLWTDILFVEAGRDLALAPVELERAGGVVAVRSEPSGASITVDGSYRGVTPLRIDVVPDRSHEIHVFLVGHAPETRRVEVPSGSERTVALTLASLQGELAIETRPEDAELWIDGELRGPATGTVTLSAVAHDIEISKPGYASYRNRVTPQPGFTQSLKVRLLTLEEARLEALKQVRTTSQGHELVLLSPGTIRMGASRREPGRRANEVLRTARLTRLFYLSRHEVTNGQFRAFASGHSSGQFQNFELDEDSQPAVDVSWLEAALYCNWLSAEDGLDEFYEVKFGKVTGFNAAALGYRLPSEAEWAWTARSIADSAATLRFPWGDKLPPPDRHGNYADLAAGNAVVVGRTIFGYNDNHIVSAPVGTFTANARGVYDLGGNVSEWMHDFYEIPDGAETVDPLGPDQGEYHVIRGASWMHGTVTDLRLSYRDYGVEGRSDLGFRIARFAE